MRINIYSYEYELCFQEKNINVLHFSRVGQFREIVTAFRQLVDGEESKEKIILSLDAESISFSGNAVLISDYFNYDFNQRSILASLQKKLEKSILQKNEPIDEMLTALAYVRSRMYEVCDDLNLDLDLKEFAEAKDLIKLFGIKISQLNNDNPVERLLRVIDVIAELGLAKLLITVNLSDYFSFEEVQEVYKYILYRGLYLLDICQARRNKVNPCERLLFIDENYDEFLIE